MAEYLSIGPVDPHTAMWMRDAVLREELPGIRQLDRRDSSRTATVMRSGRSWPARTATR
jgi:hypothetical protein